MERNHNNQTLADMYSYMLTWLTTPTSLFLLLNLTIATIFISHRFHKQPDQHRENPTGIVRTRSLIDRVRSFNYHFQLGQHVTQDTSHDENPNGIIVRAPSILERVMSFKREEQHVTHVTEDVSSPEKPTGIVRTPSMLARLKSMDFSSLYKSYVESSAGDVRGAHKSKSLKGNGEGWPEKVMKKSGSERGLVEENDDGGGGGRQRMEKTMSFGDDDGVDAKADDFINRFKQQQLKLQRLNSLLRCKSN